MYHNGREKKEYHNASHWLLRRNILSAMLCLICWWAVCDTVCIGRLADHHSAVRCALKNMLMCKLCTLCTLWSAFCYRPQEIARLCVSTCTCHPLRRSPHGIRASPPPWWRPQKSCHPPPSWSSPSVCVYQSVLVIYSLRIFSLCEFLHMSCIYLQLVSMFMPQLTLVCHCVTWETRSKLHWLRVCCPASLLETEYAQAGWKSFRSALLESLNNRTR